MLQQNNNNKLPTSFGCWLDNTPINYFPLCLWTYFSEFSLVILMIQVFKFQVEFQACPDIIIG